MSSASDVARAFGLGTPTRELTHVARGAMGVVYRLDTAAGPYAVKRLDRGAEGDEADNVAFQFAAADAGVPLARPLLTPTGEVVSEVGDGQWRAYEWVEGTHLRHDTVTPMETAIAVARHTGVLHALKYEPGGQVHEWFLGEPDERVDRVLDLVARLGIDVAAARSALRELAAVSRRHNSDEPITCHNDIDRNNVMVVGERPVFIDWDNAGPMWSACEFAGVLLNWGFDGDEATQRTTIAAMTHAYRDAGGVFDPTGLEVFSPGCSAFVKYTLNCCEHLADDDVSPEILAFERPVVEGLATFSGSVASLERLLEMVPA